MNITEPAKKCMHDMDRSDRSLENYVSEQGIAGWRCTACTAVWLPHIGRIPEAYEHKQIVPVYSKLSQADLNTVAELVSRMGFAPVIGALGDILTQSPQSKAAGQPKLSLRIGGALADAEEVDQEYPPAG